LVVVGCADGTSLLWDWRQNKTTSLQPHAGAVTAVAFPPIPKNVFTGGADGVVWVTSTEGGEHSHRRERARVTRLAISPSAEWLAVGTSRGARLYKMNPANKNLEGGAWPLADLEKAEISTLGFSRDKWLFVGTSEGDAKLYNLSSDSGRRPQTLAGHTGRITAFAFDKRGERLVTASADATARVWSHLEHPEASIPLQGHTGPLTSVAVSPSGRWAVTSGLDGTVRAWDLDRLTDADVGRRAEPRSLHHSGSVVGVVFSPGSGDSPRMVTVTRDRKLYLWDLARDRAVAALPDPLFGPPGAPVEGGDIRLTSLAFDKGDRLVAAFSNNYVVRWPAAVFQNPRLEEQLNTGVSQRGQPVALPPKSAPREVVPLPGLPRGRLRGLLSADGRRYACVGKDHKVRVWDLAGGGNPRVLEAGLSAHVALRPLSFSAEDDLLVVGWGGKAQVRKAEPGAADEALDELDLPGPPGRPGTPTHATFSPDGRWLAVSYGLGGLLVRDRRSGRSRSLTQPGEPAPYVSSLVFAVVDKRQLLISGWVDGTIRMWDLSSLSDSDPRGAPPEAVTIPTHRGRVASLAVRGDGRYLLSGHADGTALVWALPLDLLIERAGRLIESAQTLPAGAPDELPDY
jgi:WD40 repeat protein